MATQSRPRKPYTPRSCLTQTVAVALILTLAWKPSAGHAQAVANGESTRSPQTHEPPRLCSLTQVPEQRTEASSAILPASARIAASPGATPALEPAQRVELLEKWMALAEAVRADIDTTEFDVDALAAKLGADSNAAFAWVRDHTALVPYRGALRGARGVLLDRVGSSLDRALLLGELLKAGGHTVRLAHGELTDTVARQLLARPHASQVPVLRAPDFVRYARQSGLPEAEIKAAFEAGDRADRRMRTDVASRVSNELEIIAKLIGKTPAVDDRERVAAIQDHWWIQLADHDDWIDLDLDAPAKRGLTARETRDVAPLADLGAETHRVRVRVTVERWRAGDLDESSAVEREFVPGDLVGTAVTLFHAPSHPPTNSDPFTPKGVERLRTAIIDEDEWTPVLVVGKDQFADKSFTDRGEVVVRPPPVGTSASLPSADVFGGIGGALGGGEPPPALAKSPAPPKHRDAKRAGILTAEWIDYEIVVPGRPVQKIRRQIFDLVGPASRAAGGAIPKPVVDTERWGLRGFALVGRHDMLLLPAQLPEAFVTALELDNLAANNDALRDLAMVEPSQGPSAVLDIVQRIHGLPMALLDLAVSRARWARHDDVYLDGPNILAYHAQGVVEGYDIVAGDTDTRPGVARPFAARLEQGILDANLEAVLFHARSGASSSGTAELMQQHGTDWQVVRSATAAGWRSASVSPDLRARVDRDLADGSIVVVRPGENSLKAYWRLDPHTGAVLAVGDRGWGQSVTERVALGLLGFGIGYGVCRYDQGKSGTTFGAKCLCLGAVGAALALLQPVSGTLKWFGNVGIGGLGLVCSRVPSPPPPPPPPPDPF